MAQGDLAGFIEEVTGGSHLRVEEDLGGGFVRLRISEAERRQARQDIRCCEDIVLELLRNSRDAAARVVYIATAREGKRRLITAIDDGCGIPQGMHRAIFESRVTNKLDTFHDDQWGVHGRGMALFSIACNSVVHEVAASEPGKGSAIRIVADTSQLGEKTDQSSMPRLVRTSEGRTVIRGTRNINRIVSEFTLSQKGSCLVFLGSFNEVLATMVENGSRVLTMAERAFARDASEYPVSLRPALAATPDELASIAAGLGISVSSRSARRVLDGEIAPLAPFISVLDDAMAPDAKPPSRTRRAIPVRRPKFSPEDIEAFKQGAQAAYRDLAQGYYLNGDVEPKVRVGACEITVSFPYGEAGER